MFAQLTSKIVGDVFWNTVYIWSVRCYGGEKNRFVTFADMLQCLVPAAIA